MASEETPDVETKSPDSGNKKPDFFSYENIKSLAVLILIVLALRSSVASPYHVPTASMEPTIKVGDRLLAFKLAYSLKVPFLGWELINWAEVQRGDIIVFRYPNDPDKDYVKRVIGVAGDKIELINDTVYINGKAQKRTDHNFDRSILDDITDPKDDRVLFRENLDGSEHWTMLKTPQYRHFAVKNWPRPSEAPYTVPQGSVFVMGDNRDNSLDSRSWGEVPLSYVRGKAIFVIWSVYTPRGEKWPDFRFNRFGHMLDG